MTNDIPIYISPEDDVTSVRERLEKAPNRQVTLVIPAQTQLRSLVAWRVLHADARKMGKDVLVISTDPQIRSLAQAGKFRVAHSQSSSITGKSRPPTRTGRSGTGKSKFTSSQGRLQATRKPSTQFPTPDENSETNLEEHTDPLSQWYGPVPEQSFTQRDTERPFTSTTSGSLKGKSTFSPSFGEPKQEPGQIYDLFPHAAPPVYPVSPEIPLEEPGSYWAEDADYKQAADIRSTLQQANPVLPGLPQTPLEASSIEPIQSEPAPPSSIYKTTPLPQSPSEEEVSDISYPIMDDAPPASYLHEQRGSAIIDGLDIHDSAAEQSTFNEPVDQIPGGIHVEDLGEDPGTGAQLFDSSPLLEEEVSHHSWSEPLVQEQIEDAGPARNFKPNAPRSSRRENRENSALSQRQQDLDNPVALPPIEEQQTVIIPPEEHPLVSPRPRNSIPLDTPRTPTESKKPASKRASQQILGATPRPVPTARPKTNVPTRAGTNAGTRRTQGAGTGRAAPTKKLPDQSSRRSGAILLLLALLLLLLIGIPAYFVPSADVTLKLPAKSFKHDLVLKAVNSSTQKTVTGDVVPADQLTRDFEATGTGKATGTTKVGTSPATGTVTFANNGKSLVTIPSGTIVTTSNGIAFSTQAEAVVDTANSNTGGTVDVPVQAQSAGASGNVAAGNINAIPPDGLNAIAMANKISGSDLKLTVINRDATSNGGVGMSSAVSQQDIDATKASLHNTLQNTFKAWLGTKTAPGDLAETLTTSETLENAPPVGQPTPDNTFTAKLRLSVVVLVVSVAHLQQASIMQLNMFVKQDKTLPNYTVVDDAKHPVLIGQVKPTSDNKSTITLAYNATASVVPSINTQGVQNQINGKGVKDAKTILLRIPGVHQADISTAPQIGGWSPSWVPFRTANIHVHLVPEDSPTSPKK